MTTTDWIIDIALILMVVRQMREEKLTARFLLLPLGIVAFTAQLYLHSLPTAGNDLTLIGLCLVAGGTLGLIGGMITRVRARNGQVTVQAGPAAAALWIASMSARLGFIVWITHNPGSAHLATFSVEHHITSADVWQTALVVLALSEVIVRLTTVVIRGHRARSAITERPVLARV